MLQQHVPHSADGMHTLLPRQRRMRALTWPLGLACHAAARVLRTPKLEPRANTRRCYESLFDPLCGATGVWPDYTEGYFPTGEETYDEAKLAQFDYILDQCEVGEGTRMLDLGCGNGKLLERARARGADVSGITISSSQADVCQAEGLDVHLCSFQDAAAEFGPGTFDVITLNGPTEHFVSELDAAEGRDHAIREELFGILKTLLKPGGRVFITCIHFRHETDPEVTLRHPLKHPIGSYYFYCSNLIRIYSGWYLPEGTYQDIAKKMGFTVEHERDATWDYYRTSQLWSERLQDYVKANPGFTRRYLQDFFLQDPRYFFQAFLFWFYDP